MKCPVCKKSFGGKDIIEKRDSTWGSFRCPHCEVWLDVNPNKFWVIITGAILVFAGGPGTLVIPGISFELSILLMVIGALISLLSLRMPSVFPSQ